MSTATTRQTADERREAVLEAASAEFSRKGLYGASTDAIAKAAGISQPYLFRLFGTKKELYLATTRLKMEETYQAFERASRGKSGQDALHAMGEAYTGLIEDRERLLLMLQCFAGCEDMRARDKRTAWRNCRRRMTSCGRNWRSRRPRNYSSVCGCWIPRARSKSTARISDV